ncbi:SGNH/GDSL hydrolase family protein [Noviherbaspirillum sp. 1P10PC]|jgi:lysophospholipase L1-like esterase|uniref:SGNH/GDSL hydrolase family protein n=1 Tax=Noviherbaspirillum sp. 1P10PC TaxID=3132292 RepID=UPI0039A19BB7
MIAISRAVVSLLFAAGLAQPVLAQSSAAGLQAAIDPRWTSSFDAFANADKQKMPAPGGVLFVGSSSIRLWDNLEQQFNTAPIVVKRGFGGSRMEDCAAYLSRLVIPYKPRTVVVYAGENDLAEGRRPEQVLKSFTRFVEGVRAALPATRIAYVSIKPSIARVGLLADIRATNALIGEYVSHLDNARYIDVFTPMLDSRGAPRAELFREDRLHMNQAGYALWHDLISPSLR